ncbi:MAG: DNA/RNA nuclease SfsA [Lachnospiraceae bacterium]|nr:DNA/RNA nuclease SfsA [Lachnospiraceae bacterium]
MIQSYRTEFPRIRRFAGIVVFKGDKKAGYQDMKYEKMIYGKFHSRPNRFIARVWVEDVLETVHVKNTGRCQELLLPNAKLALAVSDNPKRKTRYDLISVYKENLGWVNMDSQAPNKVVGEWLKTQGYSLVKPEYTYGDSRLDFYMEKDGEKYLMEVKGCTLEIDGIGYFPDAPTERGVKHLRELAKAAREGYHCMAAFVIQMEGIHQVRANTATHKEFGEALAEAEAAGVVVLCMGCRVSADTLEIIEVWENGILPVKAEEPGQLELLSQLATRIVREHFDPIIGTAQNDYMLARFQTVEAITSQIQDGYRYYWVKLDGENAGFLAFYPRDRKIYLSKFYVAKEYRGRHLAGKMLAFVREQARQEGLTAIFLNVNRENESVIAIYQHLGFEIVRGEKNDIGGGFYMDDYVMEYKIAKWLFFDLGSTIVDEEECLKFRIEETLKQPGAPGEEEFYARAEENARQNRLPYKDTVKDFGLEQVKWPGEKETLYPQAPAVLEELSKKYKLGIIANQSAGAEERMKAWGIRDYFSVIVSSAEAGVAKPERKIFELALKKAGCEAEEAWMIGDRLDNDIEPAGSMGFHTIWVRQSSFAGYDVSRFAHGPEITVDSLEEILEHL